MLFDILDGAGVVVLLFIVVVAAFLVRLAMLRRGGASVACAFRHTDARPAARSGLQVQGQDLFQRTAILRPGRRGETGNKQQQERGKQRRQEAMACARHENANQEDGQQRAGLNRQQLPKRPAQSERGKIGEERKEKWPP